MMGPASMDQLLPTLQLPVSLQSFMRDMLELCDGSEVKEVALRGGSEEYWQRVEEQRQVLEREQNRELLAQYAVV